eukprot:1039826-Amphidinium_carterae.1
MKLGRQISDGSFLRGSSRNLCIDHTRCFVYIDNLGVLGFGSHEVCATADECKKGFTRRGLDLHDEERSKDEVQVLGVKLQMRERVTAISDARFWRVWNGLGQLLRRGRATTLELQMVLGHCNFVGLLDRGSLSIFHSSYAFCVRYQDQSSREILWDSVREELRTFRGVMFVLVADWSCKWHDVVRCSDASEEGDGVCRMRVDAVSVADCGRTLEQSRYKKLQPEVKPREFGMLQHDEQLDVSTW